MEVLEEEELAAIRAHEQQVPNQLHSRSLAALPLRPLVRITCLTPVPQFDQMRAAELAEAQRLEEAERRRQEEKEARLEQERQRLARETEVAVKVAARGYASRFVADVVDEVFDDLHAHGFFYNPVVKAVETQVLPWLLAGLKSSVSLADEAEALLQSFVAAVPAFQASKDKASRDQEAAIQAEKDRIAAEVSGACTAHALCRIVSHAFVCRQQLRRLRKQKRRQQQQQKLLQQQRRLPREATLPLQPKESSACASACAGWRGRRVQLVLRSLARAGVGVLCWLGFVVYLFRKNLKTAG